MPKTTMPTTKIVGSMDIHIGAPLLIAILSFWWLFAGVAQAETGDTGVAPTSVDTTTYICVNYGDSLLCVGADSTDSTIFRADVLMSFTNTNDGKAKRELAFFYVNDVGDTVKMARVGILQYSPADTAKVK